MLPLGCTSPRRSRKEEADLQEGFANRVGLLPPELNGSSQRRALLQRLRNNLQELRPY
jgi:hypothetical protein